jgi:hypothetical protein
MHNNNVNQYLPIILPILVQLGEFIHMLYTNLTLVSFSNMQLLLNEVVVGLYPIEDFITIARISL